MTTSEHLKIKTADNKEFSGYLSKPPSGKGPGLLLIQEIFGVNSHIRDIADLYAQAGFVVLAPDLFWRLQPKVELGYGPDDFAKGIELAGKLNMEQALFDLTDAINALKNLPSVSKKIGSIGYCRGGYFSYLIACQNQVDAAVSYYGGGIAQDLDEAKTLQCPSLMHFAGIDEYIPTEAIQKIENTMSSKPNVTVYTYPGVHHGFNCDQRGTYNRQAAMLAFARSYTFLHKYLD